MYVCVCGIYMGVFLLCMCIVHVYTYVVCIVHVEVCVCMYACNYYNVCVRVVWTCMYTVHSTYTHAYINSQQAIRVLVQCLAPTAAGPPQHVIVDVSRCVYVCMYVCMYVYTYVHDRLQEVRLTT